ncbi:MAG TPA: DUF5655 domain-containing protein [Microbacteriaceae bacterium]
MTEVQTWEPMREKIRAQLERQTGAGIDAWNAKIATQAPADEAALRLWLGEQQVGGYPQMLLVWETFGYPDFLVASADELFDAQYVDRPALRAIFDAVIGVVSGFGDVSVQARKTYVALVTPRRTFAVVQATTRTRVDVGLRLGSEAAGGRLVPTKSLGNVAIALRFGLASVDDFDSETIGWLQAAYDANR